jgi:hypothetical protein
MSIINQSEVAVWNLVIGISLELGAWNLEFAVEMGVAGTAVPYTLRHAGTGRG